MTHHVYRWSYIDTKNIVGFINSAEGKDPTIGTNWKYVKVENDKIGDIQMCVYIFIYYIPYY